MTGWDGNEKSLLSSERRFVEPEVFQSSTSVSELLAAWVELSYQVT